MRYLIAVLLLLSAAHADAAPLPDGARDRTVTPADAQRLTRLLMQSSTQDRQETTRRIKERRENAERLRAELYAASPDMILIERLRLKELELQREIMAAVNDRSEVFLRSLGPEDRLKFLRMTYPLSPMIVAPAAHAPVTRD